jgi:uncharacterized protein with NAD-binding domain and iron-sulfur cluster
MGWRLGGKGASGRNAQAGQRTEEHGLHVWFGFYENAFRLIRRVYDLLNRPEGAPLRTWEDALKPHNFIVLAEIVKGQSKIWALNFPEKPGVPGDGSERIRLWEIAVCMFEWMGRWNQQLLRLLRDSGAQISQPEQYSQWLYRLAHEAKEEVDLLAKDAARMWSAAQALIRRMGETGSPHRGHQDGLLAEVLDGIRTLLTETIANHLDCSDEMRRLFVGVDLTATVFLGMLKDGVFQQGLDVLNCYDLREWLRRHGANETYSLNSAPVTGFYDLVFAYQNGDSAKPNAEAGTLLRAMLLVACCYKGGVMWKMQAGMGDTIFTPFYQVLKERGVKFKFFHKVEELVPNGDSIGEIRMSRQATVNNGEDRYDPLVHVKGLASWPSVPNYDQLSAQEARLLKANNVNLECHWSNWPELYQSNFGRPLREVVLRKGRDFDQVIFGISLGSVPHICPKLVAQSPALKLATEKIETVATRAYQVWLKRDLRQLGWHAGLDSGDEPVLSGFDEPFDTWASMGQLLCREDWPENEESPRNVSYFCSALPASEFPPRNDHEFPARCAQQVKEAAKHQLNRQIHALWPHGAYADGFPWEWLVDTKDAVGEARFDRQYWRANVDPSERYVMSVRDSSRYRLETDGTGFRNLYVTGDWIKTGLNVGCVEAAVMAGMQTARAISGVPLDIKGENDLNPERSQSRMAPAATRHRDSDFRQYAPQPERLHIQANRKDLSQTGVSE